MLTKKVTSLLMALVMVLTMFVGTSAVVGAASADLAESSVNTATDYQLASSIQNGNILHAFNWKLEDVKNHAAEIAAAGFTSVQISPIQYTKVTSNAGSYATDWWSFYQPNDFYIGNALGNSSDLKAMVTELHKYGVKVIVDVVTNHTVDFNYDTKAESKAAWEAMSSTIKSFYRTNSMSSGAKPTDSSRSSMTTGDLGGLKDLNTENKSYQNYLITNLFNPLADAGVDGYRFDAAKHIATPKDSPSSDYWPTITNAIKSKNSNAFIYGEILSLNNLLPISAYTQYMNVTDYAYGNTVRSALSSSNASNLVNYGYTGSSKNQNVLWVESHDNFCDGVSVSISKAKQIVGWAAIGARKDAPALFFVRPEHEKISSAGFIKYDELMGFYGSADTWQNKSVVEVNKFKNAFVGQNETVTASGSMLFVQRGTTGMVISNLAATSANVSQSCSMANGQYKDQVSGATFTVSGGKISGKIGASGVAVIYNKTESNSAPEVSVKLNNESLCAGITGAYSSATATVEVTVANSTSATVKVNNLNARGVSNGTTKFTVNSSVATGKEIDFTVTANNGSKSISSTYKIFKDTSTATRKVYFDNTATKWTAVYVLAKNTANASGSFPGIKMTKQSGEIYVADVPANTTYVKFNEGPVSAHIGHTKSQCGGYCGRTLPPTVILYGDNANLSDTYRTRGGYPLVGTMICRNLHMEVYGTTSAASLSDSDIIGGTNIGPTEAPTTPTTPPTTPTVRPTTPPTTPTVPTTPPTSGGRLVLGDVDLNGKVEIVDATWLQKDLASMITLSADAQLCADVDGDGKPTIVDVTNIQKKLASISVPYDIGGYINGSAPTEKPTQAPTAAPTQAPTDEPTYAPDPTEAPTTLPAPQPLKNKWVALIYCEAFSTDPASRTKEYAFSSNGVLTFDFPGESYVFCRNWDTGVQYCTDGWTSWANPVTLVNEKALSDIANFDKMYVPAGTHTLYLYDNGDDTMTLAYDDSSVGPTPDNPTDSPDPTPSDNDLTFVPGAASEANPAWFGWVWNDGSNGQWVAGSTDSSGNVIFPGAMAYDNITIARMPSGSTQGDWSKIWNQSEDIKIQKGKTLYFTGWNSVKFTVEWK